MSCNDYASNCNDPCGRIDELLEAANALVNYRDIIEKWLHGSQNDIVQIGGQDVKTLLGLIADIKQLIGVLPDGKTIVLDDTRKVLSVLLAAGGGIKVKPEGGLYVNIDTNSGLKIDEDGKISIDFSQMPTDRFEELMKQIRVPIWLTSNKNFYVNGATGSDTLDDGRGESEGKPFKTIQACVNYVTDNYNVSRYILTINAKNGTYQNVVLPEYSRTTGRILIKGEENTSISFTGGKGRSVFVSGGEWSLENIKIQNILDDSDGNTPSYSDGIFVSNGTCSINNVSFYGTYKRTSGGASRNIRSCVSTNNGILNVNEDCSCTFTDSTSSSNKIVFFCLNGTINFSKRNNRIFYYIKSSFSTFVLCSNRGFVNFETGDLLYQMEFVADDGVTGKRYAAQSGGAINVAGKGQEYFPGNISGSVDSSSFSWYK